MFSIALECSFPLTAFESKQYFLGMISTKQRRISLAPCANWLSEVNFDPSKRMAAAWQNIVVRPLQVVRWCLLNLMPISWREAGLTGCTSRETPA